MYLFEQHNIAALHINKNAGSALRTYFVDVLDSTYKILQPEHGPLENKYKLLPKDCKIIATVRNPYDRLVSIYYHRKGNYNPAGVYAGNWKKMLRDTHTMDLKTWFIKSIGPYSGNGPPEDQPSFRSLLVAGKMPENVFVAKTETLQEDAEKFLSESNIFTDKKLPIVNVTRVRPESWRELYDAELLQLVYEWDKFTFDNYYSDITI